STWAAATLAPRWSTWKPSRKDLPTTTRLPCGASPTWSRPRSGSGSRSGRRSRWRGSRAGLSGPGCLASRRWPNAATRCWRQGGEEAEQHYLAALKLHDGPFEQARTQLLYGAWLRRARRKTDASTQLRAALDSLDGIGAAPWAEQAQAELTAIGATAPRTDR